MERDRLRMLQKPSSGVLTSLKASTRVVRKSEALEGLFRSPGPIARANGPTKCGPYLLGLSLAAALLGGLFHHPLGASRSRCVFHGIRESMGRRRFCTVSNCHSSLRLTPPKPITDDPCLAISASIASMALTRRWSNSPEGAGDREESASPAKRYSVPGRMSS